jgi:DNA-binding LytR/AlgR family response regulator
MENNLQKKTEMQEARIKPLFRLAGAQPNVSGIHLGRVIINSRDMIDVIDIKEILYLKAESNYTSFKLKSGRSLLSCKTLSHYELLLSNQGFIRTHKTFLINLATVVQIDKRNNKVILEGNEQVDISKSKKPLVCEIFKS